MQKLKLTGNSHHHDNIFIFLRYRERFWNSMFFDAIGNLTKVAEENHLTLIESALRWMAHHSGLGPNDGIIIGASSLHHLEQNLKDLAKGPLPEAMVKAFDETWDNVKVACPPYFKDEAAAKAISVSVNLTMK